MSPMSRVLTGPHLTFDLNEQVEDLRKDPSYERTGRVGRTLVKSGALRLTLVVLAQGIDAGTHRAEAPMTVQVVRGRLRFRVDDQHFEIGAGEVLFFGPDHAQDITALEDTALLLTITGEDTAEVD